MDGRKGSSDLLRQQKALGRNSLCFGALMTTLTEVEAILSSGPLTDLNEGAGETSVLPETSNFREVQGSATHLETVRKFQYKKRHVDHFWKRWRPEYLLELR